MRIEGDRSRAPSLTPQVPEDPPGRGGFLGAFGMKIGLVFVLVGIVGIFVYAVVFSAKKPEQEPKQEVNTTRPELRELNESVQPATTVTALGITEDLKVGSQIAAFGGYTWDVIAIKNGRALLVTENVIGTHAFHQFAIDAPWSESDIRVWLNTNFLQDSFNSQEQRVIVESKLANDSNTEYWVSGGEETDDRIFLLSAAEVEEYLKDPEQRLVPSQGVGEAARGTSEEVWWWLRTPGQSQSRAACVDSTGKILLEGVQVNSQQGGVRAACWVRLAFSVDVLNGWGVSGAADETRKILVEAGYSVEKKNALGFIYEYTYILYRTEDDRLAAEDVQARLGCGIVAPAEGRYDFTSDVLVILGHDYEW